MTSSLPTQKSETVNLVFQNSEDHFRNSEHQVGFVLSMKTQFLVFVSVQVKLCHLLTTRDIT